MSSLIIIKNDEESLFCCSISYTSLRYADITPGAEIGAEVIKVFPLRKAEVYVRSRHRLDGTFKVLVCLFSNFTAPTADTLD